MKFKKQTKGRSFHINGYIKETDRKMIYATDKELEIKILKKSTAFEEVQEVIAAGEVKKPDEKTTKNEKD